MARGVIAGCRGRPEKIAIGQFDPGHAGGANSGPLGDAGALANPWDYVLTFEGALLFASGAARRLSSEASGRASIPFTVALTEVGYGASADENNKGELWAPLWEQPITFAELAKLMGEGRSEWRGRQSRTGLDFVRSVASLGVDRGISGFVRYAFVERHGQMMLAVPVDHVTARSSAEAPLLGQLDAWLDRVRSAKNLPQGIRAFVRRVEAAQYLVATYAQRLARTASSPSAGGALPGCGAGACCCSLLSSAGRRRGPCGKLAPGSIAGIRVASPSR